MASPISISATVTLLAIVVLLLGGNSSSAQLSAEFYSSSCPKIESVIKQEVQAAISKEARMGASILRLFFHDCFVQGCDGSVLLDDTGDFTGEKTAEPSLNSARGFEAIDTIKDAVDRVCPGVVSCADILAVAARDSVVSLGGPYWEVKLGRRDSRTASRDGANNNIPAPTANLTAMISKFAAQGLSALNMVALIGGHTIGYARCTNFRARIYNDTDIDRGFAVSLQDRCPSTSGSGDDNLQPLTGSPNVFSNDFYLNLAKLTGLLHSDQELVSGVLSDAEVRSAVDSALCSYGVQSGISRSGADPFFKDFTEGMIRMGDIGVLTGSDGEIRKNCRRIN